MNENVKHEQYTARQGLKATYAVKIGLKKAKRMYNFHAQKGGMLSMKVSKVATSSSTGFNPWLCGRS